MTQTVTSTKRQGRSGVQRRGEIRDVYDGLRIWSALTHGGGALFALVGGIVLVWQVCLRGGDMLAVMSLLIFCCSMVALYTASCLYHSVSTTVRGRIFLRKLDHAMIYVLIAGTYTPVTLSVLGDISGMSMLIAIWIMAVAGIFVTLFWMNAPRALTTVFYIAMGWTAVLAMKSLVAALEPAAMFWMLTGGILYTIGGILYAVKWPLKHGRVFGCHEIFHVFVLLGSVSFYMMMWVQFTAK